MEGIYNWMTDNNSTAPDGHTFLFIAQECSRLKNLAKSNLFCKDEGPHEDSLA